MEDWKTDSNGKRYRDIVQFGINVREYEPTITTTEGTFTEEQLKTLKRDPVPLPKAINKRCPFRSGITVNCYGDDCALYKNGCTLARIRKSGNDTNGKRCPFTGSGCAKDCALYKNGCALAQINGRKGR